MRKSTSVVRSMRKCVWYEDAFRSRLWQVLFVARNSWSGIASWNLFAFDVKNVVVSTVGIVAGVLNVLLALLDVLYCIVMPVCTGTIAQGAPRFTGHAFGNLVLVRIHVAISGDSRTMLLSK